MEDIRVNGNCHGLCLLFYSETFVIWNPTTGDSRKLSVTTQLHNRFFGLGYDCLSRDHKLMVVIKSGMTISSNLGKEFNYRVEDYSLKSQAVRCKCAPGTIDFMPRVDSAIYSNHRLYWEGKAINRLQGIMERDAILTYNLQKDVLNYLPLPDIDRAIFQGIVPIKDGDLCAFFYVKGQPYHFEVWAMKKHGVSSPWTLLYSFEDHYHFSRENPECYYDLSLHFLGVLDDGSLVMDNAGYVSNFFPVDGEPTRHKLDKLKGAKVYVSMRSRSWMYKESLFSPSTEEAGQNLVGCGRFARHQADETGGSSTRKLAQLVCIKTRVCPLWIRYGSRGFRDYCLFAHRVREVGTMIPWNIPCSICNCYHDLAELQRYGHLFRICDQS